MTLSQRVQRRSFDIFASFLGLLFLWWLILIVALIARIETGLNGFFFQERVGRNGKLINVYKIRSMKPIQGVSTSVTTDKDPRISRLGKFWRKSKIDELPQLWNVLKGDMSFVGPRPDVPGFADNLQGEDRLLLKVRPGITGPATLLFKNEEEILSQQEDPEKYNLEVIWPEKVRINLEYFENYSFQEDIRIILITFLPRLRLLEDPKLVVNTNQLNYINPSTLSHRKVKHKEII